MGKKTAEKIRRHLVVAGATSIAELPVPLCFLMLIIQAVFEIKKMVSGITPPSGEH